MNNQEYADMVLQPEIEAKKVFVKDEGREYEITLLLKGKKPVGLFAERLFPVERAGCYGDTYRAENAHLTHEKKQALFIKGLGLKQKSEAEQ